MLSFVSGVNKVDLYSSILINAFAPQRKCFSLRGSRTTASDLAKIAKEFANPKIVQGEKEMKYIKIFCIPADSCNKKTALLFGSFVPDAVK